MIAPEAPAEMVEALKAMGFDEAQVTIALRLSCNNLELAATLLMEPEMMLQAQQMEESGGQGGSLAQAGTTRGVDEGTFGEEFVDDQQAVNKRRCHR